MNRFVRYLYYVEAHRAERKGTKRKSKRKHRGESAEEESMPKAPMEVQENNQHQAGFQGGKTNSA